MLNFTEGFCYNKSSDLKYIFNLPKEINQYQPPIPRVVHVQSPPSFFCCSGFCVAFGFRIPAWWSTSLASLMVLTPRLANGGVWAGSASLENMRFKSKWIYHFPQEKTCRASASGPSWRSNSFSPQWGAGDFREKGRARKRFPTIKSFSHPKSFAKHIRFHQYPFFRVALEIPRRKSHNKKKCWAGVAKHSDFSVLNIQEYLQT